MRKMPIVCSLYVLDPIPPILVTDGLGSAGDLFLPVPSKALRTMHVLETRATPDHCTSISTPRSFSPVVGSNTLAPLRFVASCTA